jgi:hypothetical protein
MTPKPHTLTVPANVVYSDPPILSVIFCPAKIHVCDTLTNQDTMFHLPPALALTEDILLEIFYLLQSIPLAHSVGKSRFRLPIVVLSHVTRQWREFIINAPLLWANIRVTGFLRLDALRTIISRSGHCELDVSFLSSPVPLGSARSRRLRESLHLRDSASLLAPYLTRWRRLRIVADSSSMQYIMLPVINVLFPRLQCLELKLIHHHSQTSRLSFGPLYFNPHVFTTLRLHQVTIRTVDPSHFSGLKNLQLSQTSCGIIDQALLTSTLPTVPIFTNAPSMNHVTHLTISTPFPPLPALLSIIPMNLTTITFSNFRCTSLLQRATLMNLFNVLITPRLEELMLADIDGEAWDAFLEFSGMNGGVGNGLIAIHGNVTRFPTLKRLTLKSLAIHGVDQHFGEAFPKIKCLALVDIDPSLVLALLHNGKINQLLWHMISVNGSEIGAPGWP